MGDGTLTASAMNGTAPYTYVWNTINNDTTLFVANQDVGTYTVTVTDANGCTDIATTTITQDDPVDALSSLVPIECAGGTAASITVMPTGGTAPYSYLWSTASMDTTATIDSLGCLLYTSPSPRDATLSRMPSSA